MVTFTIFPPATPRSVNHYRPSLQVIEFSKERPSPVIYLLILHLISYLTFAPLSLATPGILEIWLIDSLELAGGGGVIDKGCDVF